MFNVVVRLCHYLQAVKGGAGQNGDPQDLKDHAESADRIQILEAQVKELNSQELLSRSRCEQVQCGGAPANFERVKRAVTGGAVGVSDIPRQKGSRRQPR